jgi:hypothetical protein
MHLPFVAKPPKLEKRFRTYSLAGVQKQKFNDEESIPEIITVVVVNKERFLNSLHVTIGSCTFAVVNVIIYLL